MRYILSCQSLKLDIVYTMMYTRCMHFVEWNPYTGVAKDRKWQFIVQRAAERAAEKQYADYPYVLELLKRNPPQI